MRSRRGRVRRDEGAVILTVRKSAFIQFAIYFILYLLEYVITSPAPGYRKGKQWYLTVNLDLYWCKQGITMLLSSAFSIIPYYTIELKIYSVL